MNIAALPQKAQIWLDIIQFQYIGYHFQRMMFAIASIMSNESLSDKDKAQQLAEFCDDYDETDQEIVLKYVTKYSKFDAKRWTK